ncbi:MAG: V-type ATP synthase subunit I [Candidatus Geothermarchaeales archaeon]
MVEALLRPTPMKRFYVAVPTKYEDEVIRALGGVAHLIKDYTIRGAKREENVEVCLRYMRLLQRINSILPTFVAEKPAEKSRLEAFKERFRKPSIERPEKVEIELDEISSYVQTVESKLDGMLGELEKTQAEIDELRKTREEIEVLQRSGLRIDEIGDFKLIFVKAGFLSHAALPRFERYVKGTSIMYTVKPKDGREDFIVATGLNEDKSYMETTLKLLNFKEIRLPEDIDRDPSQALTKIANTLEEKERRYEELREELVKIGGEFKRKSSYFEPYVRRTLQMEEARSAVSKTATLSLIHGWVPSSKIDSLKKDVEATTEKEFHLEFEDPSPGEEVPSQIKNKGVFGYFELFTRLRGLPNYFELDPTPIVTVLFVIMFGMMFGDIGDGICLIVLGFIFSRMYKGFLGIGAVAVRRLGGILLTCGVSSVIFGALYGEFFLYEVFHPLLLSPLHDQTLIMVIALLFGVIQIAIGLVLSTINEFRKKDRFKAVFSGRGLMGLIYYVCGVALAIKYAYTMSLTVFIENLPLTVVVIGALIVIFISPIVESIREGELRFMEDLMKGFSEALETFISFLTNSISYVRLAAFAIAHAALGLSAAILAGMIGSLPSYLFLNFLVFIIEGLSVIIQSMRLTYYEFFTKFYSGGGTTYKPLTLGARTSREA